MGLNQEIQKIIAAKDAPIILDLTRFRPSENATPIVINILGNANLQFAQVVTPYGFDQSALDQISLPNISDDTLIRARNVLLNS